MFLRIMCDKALVWKARSIRNVNVNVKEGGGGGGVGKEHQKV